MIGTHPVNGRDVGEVSCVLVAVCRKADEVSGTVSCQRKCLDMIFVSHRISLLTGHAMTLSVTEKSVAAPGPFGV